MNSPLSRGRVLSGRPAIGLGVPTATSGYPAHGCWLLSRASYGLRAIGPGTTMTTSGMKVTGDQKSAFTAELTMGLDTLDMGITAGIGTTEPSFTTRR